MSSNKTVERDLSKVDKNDMSNHPDAFMGWIRGCHVERLVELSDKEYWQAVVEPEFKEDSVYRAVEFMADRAKEIQESGCEMEFFDVVKKVWVTHKPEDDINPDYMYRPKVPIKIWDANYKGTVDIQIPASQHNSEDLEQDVIEAVRLAFKK